MYKYKQNIYLYNQNINRIFVNINRICQNKILQRATTSVLDPVY